MKFLHMIGFVPLRILAMLTGMVFFTLRALFFGSLLALGAIVVGATLLVALTFVAPFLLARELIRKGLSIAATILFIPVAALLFFVLAISALPIFAVGFCLLTPIVLLDSAWKGIKAGFSRGFDVLVYGTHRDYSFFERLFYRIIGNRLPEVELPDFEVDEENEPVQEAWEVLPVELEDVPVARPEIPDMESKEGITASELLPHDQIKIAKDHLLLPIGPLKKLLDNLENLKLTTERYIDLSTDLENVQNALRAEDLSEIDDVLTGRDIQIPILFEKQYFENDTWHTVPTQSYVSDKQSLLVTWFQESKPEHPLTRDSIIEPARYNDKPTRYRWRELKADDCQSQELFETAEKIKVLLQEIQESPVEIHVKSPRDEKPVRITRSRSMDFTLFGGKGSSDNGQSSNEQPRP